MKITIFLALNIVTRLLYGQQFFIYQGTITDAQTKVGIEGVHIFSDSRDKIGTISNSDGNFILKSPEKLSSLSFSHISYKPYKYVIKENSDEIEVRLTPQTKNLKEITITSITAKQVVEKAIQNLNKNHFVEPVYYEFFTRIINFSKDSILNFLEEHTGYIYQKKNHNSEFSLQNSRMNYFSQTGKKLYETHRLISMSEMFTDNMGKYTEDYLHKRKYNNYHFSFDDDISIMGRECYTIKFLTDKDTYYKKGVLFIDKKDFGIVRKVLNGSDYKEITFKKVDRKYFLSSTFYKKSRGDTYETRNTIYNLTAEPNNTKFIEKGRLAPEFTKRVTKDFNDDYWGSYNMIPLPEWVISAMHLTDNY